ncbi:hypothetical protein GCM10023184_43300 [Flaviaesturariibacter amylovorans]|uniref:VWFA domain-containing protein n=2 Tax=Flaviaesturariibacter amylovorans TaxID=1084520 RepID=A0ABP8HRE7_9BACT
MKVPKRYLDEPNGTILPPNSPTDEGIVWVVCSDRSNNKTFSNSNGDGSYKTMDFMEKFYVTEEKGEYLHLYKYDELERMGGASYDLKPTAVDYGWAPKSKLLLWLRSQVSNRKISEKVLPILTDKSYKNSDVHVKQGGRLKLFKDPGLTQVSDIGITMFQFLFVYKREGKSVLVGKGAVSFPDRIDSDVLGWVSDDIAVTWADRVCLEFNMSDAAIAERKSKGKASLFASQQDATEWKKGKGGAPIWDADPLDRERSPLEKRLPIISEDKDNNVFKTGYVTSILDESGKQVMTVDDAARIEREAHDAKTSARKVNIVFVVDGSSGMKEYLSVVENVVERLVERRRRIRSDNDIKYGAVLYRDEMDNRCPGGELDISQMKALDTDAETVIDFIKKNGSIAGCQRTSRAVNKGIYMGLRLLASASKNKNETKVLVVLGGGKGRSTGQYADENLIKMAAENKVNLLTFQVAQGRGADYDQFPLFCRRLMVEASKQSVKLNAGTAALINARIDPKFESYGDYGFRLVYPTTTDIMGVVAFPPPGSALSAATINESLDSTFAVVDADIERKVVELNAVFDGIGQRGFKVDASVVRYLQSISEKVDDPQLIKRFYKDNYQFFIPGYTTLSREGYDNDVYTKTLYMSEDELINLQQNLKSLYDQTNMSETREKLVNTFITILGSYLGDQKKARENIMNKKWNAAQVMEVATSLPSKNPLLTKKPILDYLDPKATPDEEIIKLTRVFKAKFDDINSVIGNPKYRLALSWGVYYWVNEENLP